MGLEQAFGELSTSDAKKLVVTVGVNSEEYHQKNWMGFVNKAFDLTPLMQRSNEAFRWVNMAVGQELPSFRVVPVGMGYVSRNRRNESGTLNLEKGKMGTV